MRSLDAWLAVALVSTTVLLQACTPRDRQLDQFAVVDDGGTDADIDAAVDGSDAFDAPDADAPDDADAAVDADVNAAVDAVVDAAVDADVNAAVDADVDAAADADVDAAVDADVDAAVDAGGLIDAPTDTMVDAGVPDAMADAGIVVAVEVTPSLLDFGEVRVSTSEPIRVITVTNLPSSTGSTQVTALALRIGIAELELSTPTLPFTLAPGESAQATLRLETLVDVDLAGEHVDVTFTTGVRSVEVLGKVVTPSSRIAPSPLDLGTACVGTTVIGSLMLINDGTATLAVDAPQIGPSFVVSSAGTPTVLPPMGSLTATVSPASTAAGPLEATLLWHDDVPTDHMVPVILDYVVSGTAVSPRGLDFGTVPVESLGISQKVQLQNCDLVPSTIVIESLRTKQGPLGAWLIDPPVGTKRQLTTHQVQETFVTFDPPGRGRYEAELTLKTPEGRTVIQLFGESTGRDFGTTSFYACMCSGSGPITHAWPIFAAVAVVLRRRRRMG